MVSKVIKNGIDHEYGPFSIELALLARGHRKPTGHNQLPTTWIGRLPHTTSSVPPSTGDTSRCEENIYLQTYILLQKKRYIPRLYGV